MSNNNQYPFRVGDVVIAKDNKYHLTSKRYSYIGLVIEDHSDYPEHMRLLTFYYDKEAAIATGLGNTRSISDIPAGLLTKIAAAYSTSDPSIRHFIFDEEDVTLSDWLPSTIIGLEHEYDSDQDSKVFASFRVEKSSFSKITTNNMARVLEDFGIEDKELMNQLSVYTRFSGKVAIQPDIFLS